jgi:hypothetical protein
VWWLTKKLNIHPNPNKFLLFRVIYNNPRFQCRCPCKNLQIKHTKNSIIGNSDSETCLWMISKIIVTDFPCIKAIRLQFEMLSSKKLIVRKLRKGKHQLQPRSLTRNIQSSELVGIDGDHFSLLCWDNYWKRLLT